LRSEVKSEIFAFDLITKSYKTSGIVAELDHFIRTHKAQRNAYKLLDNLINVSSDQQDTKSVVETFLEHIEGFSGRNFNNYVSSTNRMMFDFYISIYVLVTQSNALLQLAYSIKHQMTGESNPEDFAYCINEQRELLKLLTTSMEETLGKLSKESSQIFMNLMTEGNNTEVKFQNVYQLFWQGEGELSATAGGGKNCTNDCEYFSGKSYNGGSGCYGTLHNCRSHGDVIAYADVS